MGLNALAWRGLQALAAVIAALASMACFFFVVLSAFGAQAWAGEGRPGAFQGVAQLAAGFALAFLSSWLAWRILAPRWRLAFAGLLVVAAIAARPLGGAVARAGASDDGFIILLVGGYALVALVMFVLVELGHRLLRAAAAPRSA